MCAVTTSWLPDDHWQYWLLTILGSEYVLTLSINHWGNTPRDVSSHRPSDTSSGDYPMQAPFPYQATPNRKHRLTPATNFVGTRLASSIPGYLFQKQPDKQDQLLGNVPHAHIAGVDVDGLCW